MNIENRIAKAKTQLLLNEPFYGAIAVRLPFVANEKEETIATDGTTIFYNPEWLSGLSDDEIKGTLVYMLMQIIFKHHTRRQYREKKTWNDAAAHVINDILLKNNYTLPQPYTHDPKFGNMTTEQAYRILHIDQPPQDDNKNDGGGNGGGNGDDGGNQNQDNPSQGWGRVDDGTTDGTGRSSAEIEEDTNLMVNSALAAAKQAGKIPGGLERLIKDLDKPKVSWPDQLQHHMTKPRTNNKTWNRPNRRLLATCYLPYKRIERTGEVVIAIDTSGSVTEEELKQFAAEINSVVTEMQPRKTHVLYVDTKLQNVQTFEPGDTVVLEPKGGGGTLFEPAFDWVETNLEDKPEAFVYLTDGYGSFPQEPEYPVIWAMSSDVVAPFGETINMME